MISLDADDDGFGPTSPTYLGCGITQLLAAAGDSS